jgi:hypothetical protein
LWKIGGGGGVNEEVEMGERERRVEGGIYDSRCTREERLGKRGQKPYE